MSGSPDRDRASDPGPAPLPEPLPRSFYDRDPESVARDLLGMWIVRRFPDEPPRIGRVVETEAYLGIHDLASHSSRGRTPRTQVMFGPPGHAYVYLIYGMYHCLNAVTEPEGQASAVLIRALEPVSQIDGNPRGPGRLCRLLSIDRTFHGLDLTGPGPPALYFAAPDPEVAPFTIDSSPRIGVDYAGDWAERPLRFTVHGSPWLSRPAGKRKK